MTTASHEIERIEQAYRKRRATQPGSFYKASTVFMTQMVERSFIALLRDVGAAPLDGRRVLDVGTAGGFFLRSLLKYGARPSDLFGVDLRHQLMAEGHDINPALGLSCADARSLPFADNSFDIVMQTTMLSSVVNPALRADIANEMLRVLRPGGWLLSYDFRVRRPNDKDVVAITREELRRLFPGFPATVHGTGFPPVFARVLASRSDALCQIASAIWPIPTHYWAAVRKG